MIRALFFEHKSALLKKRSRNPAKGSIQVLSNVRQVSIMRDL